MTDDGTTDQDIPWYFEHRASVRDDLRNRLNRSLKCRWLRAVARFKLLQVLYIRQQQLEESNMNNKWTDISEAEHGMTAIERYALQVEPNWSLRVFRLLIEKDGTDTWSWYLKGPIECLEIGQEMKGTFTVEEAQAKALELYAEFVALVVKELRPEDQA